LPRAINGVKVGVRRRGGRLLRRDPRGLSGRRLHRWRGTCALNLLAGSKAIKGGIVDIADSAANLFNARGTGRACVGHGVCRII
jgi:hypothetical protein